RSHRAFGLTDAARPLVEAFRYKAMDERGRILRGKVDAVNSADLEVRLSRMGLDLLNFSQLKSARQAVTGSGIRTVDLITFCFHLDHLIRAGVPILEGLGDLRDTLDNKRLRQVTAAMIESIEGGKNLSGAMADFPAVFDTVFVSLIRAGEQSGRLPEVMQKIIENLKWRDEQTSYTKKLLLYPAIVSVVIVVVLFFLMLYVVPQLVSFLGTMGQTLPLQTRALIATSGFLSTYWYVVAAAPLMAIGGIWAALRLNPDFAQRFDHALLRLPLIGPILKKIIITRVCNVFAIMYTSGITVLDCMHTGEDVAANRAVQVALRDAGRMIADGGGISASFAATGLFPPLVVRMLRVGENTGALEEALNNVTYFFTRDVRDSIIKLQTLILPVVTILLGILVLWIMSSILGPIYDLFTQIKF
ncbi:MAG: type II secretion system F family protein, partial [Gammaproteobacteria bacterium]